MRRRGFGAVVVAAVTGGLSGTMISPDAAYSRAARAALTSPAPKKELRLALP